MRHVPRPLEVLGLELESGIVTDTNQNAYYRDSWPLGCSLPDMFLISKECTYMYIYCNDWPSRIEIEK